MSERLRYSEQQVLQEMQEMLPKVVDSVSWLIYGDRELTELGIQLSEERDQSWRRVAKRSGPYAETVSRLGEVLKTSYSIADRYPEMAQWLESFFPDYFKPMPKSLLTYLLLVQVAPDIIQSRTEGDFDAAINIVKKQVGVMYNMLGLNAGGGIAEDLENCVKLDEHGVTEWILKGLLTLPTDKQLERAKMLLPPPQKAKVV